MEIPHTPFYTPEMAVPDTVTALKFAADEVLDLAGNVFEGRSSDRNFLRAIVAVDKPVLTAARADTLPRMCIAKPIGEFADDARFTHVVSYAMRDSVSSCFVVLGKAGPDSAEFNYSCNVAFDGEYKMVKSKAQRDLTEVEGHSMLIDLNRILKSARL